jgi:RNA polymerase sigma-70 factor (ECF subfamily)
MTTSDCQEPGCIFDAHRRRLIGIAYRMLGSIWDAEDVVAEASARWLRTDHATVRDPAAFLTTMVSRIALDELKSARRNRETYVGPWLPEPLLTEPALDPLDRTERRDSVHIATLRLLERLTPPERAVYVLREGFDVPYDQIADVVGVTEDNARQLLHRARRHLEEKRRGTASAEEHAVVVRRFVDAITRADLDLLTELLAADVVAYSDGGGKVRAAPRPVVGRTNVVRFLAGIMRRFPIEEAITIEANAQPAVRLALGGRLPFVALEVCDGAIVNIFTVINPDKLRYIDRQVASRN